MKNQCYTLAMDGSEQPIAVPADALSIEIMALGADVIYSWDSGGTSSAAAPIPRRTLLAGSSKAWDGLGRSGGTAHACIGGSTLYVKGTAGEHLEVEFEVDRRE
ncbi:hypothetical protein RAS1_42260 [Phycisphaerae bacterium RAS1]|nr:hypothetical protein RAS1_42260 [Phycisphaerae bacterium RAS1]